MSQFLTQFYAPSHGLLRWPQWEALRELLIRRSDGNWYVYYVGDLTPTAPLADEDFLRFLSEVDQLLRRDHQEEYFGIVYADNIDDPTFIKIFDPNNLGAACGSSSKQILPSWLITRVKPIDLHAEFTNTGTRRRWWQSLFGREDRASSSLKTRNSD